MKAKINAGLPLLQATSFKQGEGSGGDEGKERFASDLPNSEGNEGKMIRDASLSRRMACRIFGCMVT